MTLTPLDLKKQEFERVFRGYDPVAVDAFLELAAEEMGRLVTKVNGLEERVRGLSSTLEDYRQMERTLKDTMVSAQKLADEAKDAAEREAGLHRKEAKLQAREIVSDAERRRDALERRIEELESLERAFVRKMQTFLDEQARALESLPLGAPIVEEDGGEGVRDRVRAREGDDEEEAGEG